MVKLRLLQTGKKHQRQFRIVAIESSRKRDSSAIETIGWYNPRTSEIEVDKEAAQKWINAGAQPTETVKNILTKEGVIK